MSSDAELHVSQAIAAHWLVCVAAPLFLRAADQEESALRLFKLEAITSSDLEQPRPRLGVIASSLVPVARELDAERRELTNRLLATGCQPTIYRYGSPLAFRKKFMPQLTELGDFGRRAFTRSRLGSHAYYAMSRAIDVEQLRRDLERPLEAQLAPTLVSAYQRAIEGIKDLVELDAIADQLSFE